jgi:hypothetical protein
MVQDYVCGPQGYEFTPGGRERTTWADQWSFIDNKYQLKQKKKNALQSN